MSSVWCVVLDSGMVSGLSVCGRFVVLGSVLVFGLARVSAPVSVWVYS